MKNLHPFKSEMILKSAQANDCDISTFSIVGRSQVGKQLGVAVASKFLAVGAYVPAASVHGALATQASTNMALRREGLAMLASGAGAQEVLDRFFASDPHSSFRQVGAVDKYGSVATFTGADCKPLAGGRANAHARGYFAVQGNLLAGPGVIDAMVDSWCHGEASSELAWRLIASLEACQAAGVDKRGDQAAAVYVIEAGKGYEGTSDVLVDLRCDDSDEPIDELRRLLVLHDEMNQG